MKAIAIIVAITGTLTILWSVCYSVLKLHRFLVEHKITFWQWLCYIYASKIVLSVAYFFAATIVLAVVFPNEEEDPPLWAIVLALLPPVAFYLGTKYPKHVEKKREQERKWNLREEYLPPPLG